MLSFEKMTWNISLNKSYFTKNKSFFGLWKHIFENCAFWINRSIVIISHHVVFNTFIFFLLLKSFSVIARFSIWNVLSLIIYTHIQERRNRLMIIDCSFSLIYQYIIAKNWFLFTSMLYAESYLKVFFLLSCVYTVMLQLVFSVETIEVDWKQKSTNHQRNFYLS